MRDVRFLAEGWLRFEGADQLQPFDSNPARIVQSASSRWRPGQIVVWKGPPLCAGDHRFIHESQVVAELDAEMLEAAHA